MLRGTGICFLILLCALQSYAVDAVVSHTVFYKQDPTHKDAIQPYVETSWQINPRSLHYVTTQANMIVAHVRTDIVFSNENGILQEDHFIMETIPRRSVEELERHSIVDLRNYGVSAGTIKMEFILTDLEDSTHHFVFTDSFSVAEATPAPFYSDIQLLDTILPAQQQNLFLKNNQLQIPAGTNFLADNKRWLHYYAELYQTAGLQEAAYPLIQRIFISKRPEDPPTKKFSRSDTVKGRNMLPVWGSMDISSLVSGNYFLRVTLENSAHAVIASKNLFFQRMNTHPVIDTAMIAAAANDTGMENVNVLNLNKTFVGKYSLAEIRAILKMLLPVSDPAGVSTIQGFLKKPDEIYMRYYIYNFFHNQNKKDPAKAWKDYTVRVKEVNKLFTAGGVPGYETERGHIYLRYGAPTDIITVESETNALPYEIWQYNELTEKTGRSVANALFLFYRPAQMISGFKLLHSTVIGEMQNPAWRTFLYKSNDITGSTDSRAEQFIGSR